MVTQSASEHKKKVVKKRPFKNQGTCDGAFTEEKIDIKEKAIKVDTGKGNTIKVTMSYGEQSTLEELLIAYLGQEIVGGSAA